MRTFGLIGFPLGHSFSRQYFSHKFESEHISARYLNFELPDMGDLMELLAEYPELEGFNVTVPYKKLILPYLTTTSPMAAAIGAVNVVKVEQTASGPALHGFNTDAPAFARTLGWMLPHSPGPLHTLVLGSGGASAAVIHALDELGITATVVSRTPRPGMLDYSQLTADVMNRCRIVVNTTPVGMSPHTDKAPAIPYHLLTAQHICYDLIYNPPVTEFLRRAAEHGALTANGQAMLELQAALSWQIWNRPQQFLSTQ